MCFHGERPCRVTEPRAATKQSFISDGSWPIASTMKVGFGAAQARRLLTAVEINDRIGADRDPVLSVGVF